MKPVKFEMSRVQDIETYLVDTYSRYGLQCTAKGVNFVKVCPIEQSRSVCVVV